MMSGGVVRRPPSRRRPELLLGVGLSLAMGAAALLRGDPPGDPLANGRRLYREGVLPSGTPVVATVQGDVEMTGRQAACSSCHRRSGLGSNEGPASAPPVAGAVLFRPVEPDNRVVERSRAVSGRSAYTEATLARAILHGVDADGRTLDPMMPRYMLADGDMAVLIEYLQSLSPGPDPGVDADTVHLAVVIAGDTTPARRRAVLEVMRGFAKAKNALTRREFDRRAYARRRGAVEYRAYRSWTLHEWQLSGPPGTWEGQLEAVYAAQPVFALVGGLSETTWEPVQSFCERLGLPAILPQVTATPERGDEYYTVYFSRGLALEADALARYLTDEEGARGAVMQVFRRDGIGELGATALRQALAAGGVRPEEVAIGGTAGNDPWREVADRCHRCDLVLWLGAPDVGRLGEAAHLLAGAHRIVLSASLAGTEPPLPDSLRGRTIIAYPYDLPDRAGTRLQRPLTWLRSQGLADGEERTRVDALFAAMLAGEALKDLGPYLSRELLLERIEHMMESQVPTSSYPRLTLSPGDRYAAKGCFVVRAPAVPGGKVVALSDWIVP